MITTESRQILVTDMGQIVPWVKSWNSETEEAKIYIQAGTHDDGKPRFLVVAEETTETTCGRSVAVATVKIRGGKLVDKDVLSTP